MGKNRLGQAIESAGMSLDGKTLPLFLLAVLLCLHFLMNSILISEKPFWLDEALTYEMAKLPPLDIPNALTQVHKQPPLYYWVAHIVLSFGDSPALLRGVSFVFMACAIGFIMLGLTELSVSSRLIGALLMTVNPFVLYLSREFRPYAMAVFFILVSSVLLYRALLRGRNSAAAIAYGIAAVGLQYSLILNCWVFACQMLAVFVYLLFFTKENGLRTAIETYRSLLAICLILSIGYTLFLFWISRDPTDWQYAGYSTFWSALGSNIIRFLVPNIMNARGLSGLIGLIALGLFVTGIVLTIKKKAVVSLFLMAVFIGQVMFSTYMLYDRLSWFAPRYLTACFVAFVLFGALGYELAVARRWPGKKSLIPVLILLFSVFPGALWTFGNVQEQPVRKPQMQKIFDSAMCPKRRNILFCSPGYQCSVASYAYRNLGNVEVFKEMELEALTKMDIGNTCILYQASRTPTRPPGEQEALDFLDRRVDLSMSKYVINMESSSSRAIPDVFLYVFRPIPGAQ